MPETNLFEIFAVDDDGSTAVEPTAWLKSLPRAEQRTHVQHYLSDLQEEYDGVADTAERARVSKLMAAARRHLSSLGP